MSILTGLRVLLAFFALAIGVDLILLADWRLALAHLTAGLCTYGWLRARRQIDRFVNALSRLGAPQS